MTMKKEYSEKEHQECAASLGLDAAPALFTECILDARANGPGEPVTVAECPEITREGFLRWQSVHGESATVRHRALCLLDKLEREEPVTETQYR